MADNRYRESGGRFYGEQDRRRAESIFDSGRTRSDYDRDREDRGFFRRAGEEVRSWFRDENDDRYDRDYRNEGRFDRDRYQGRAEYSGGSGGAFGSVGAASRDYGMRARDRDEERRGAESRRHPQTIRNEPGSGRYGAQRSPSGQQDLGEGEFFRRGQAGGRLEERYRARRPEQSRGDLDRSSRFDQDQREFGLTYPQYSAGPHGGFSDVARGRSQQLRGGGPGRGEDEEYRSWRERQLAQLDRDYQEYCRERQQEFDRDFDSWRQTRQGRGGQSTSTTLGTHQATIEAGSTGTAAASTPPGSARTQAGSSAGTRSDTGKTGSGSGRSTRSGS